MDIWESQEGRCAITDLPMTHRYNDPKAVSIDRINSSKGHVRDNIQLVCQWVNRAKNNMANEEFKDVLLECLETIKE